MLTPSLRVRSLDLLSEASFSHPLGFPAVPPPLQTDLILGTYGSNLRAGDEREPIYEDSVL